MTKEILMGYQAGKRGSFTRTIFQQSWTSAIAGPDSLTEFENLMLGQKSM